MASKGEEASVALLHCIIDHTKFGCAQLDIAQANDLYENGRESETCKLLLEKSFFYGGKTLSPVYDKAQKLVTTERVIIYSDQRVRFENGNMIFVEDRKKNDGHPFNAFSKETSEISLDAPVGSPGEPEGAQINTAEENPQEESVTAVAPPPVNQNRATTQVIRWTPNNYVAREKIDAQGKKITVISAKKTGFRPVQIKKEGATAVASTSTGGDTAPNTTITVDLTSSNNLSVAGTPKRKIENIVEQGIRSMHISGEMHHHVAKVAELGDIPPEKFEGVTDQGLLLLNLYGHIVANLNHEYLQRSQAILSYNRTMALNRLSSSALAKKIHNFTVFINTDQNQITLVDARPPSPTRPLIDVGGNKGKGKKKEDHKDWKPWERTTLMEQYEEVLKMRNVSCPWKEVSKRLMNYGIIAGNEQCRTCHTTLKNRYNKLMAVGATGSEPIPEEVLDTNIMEHFQKLEVFNPTYVRSNIRGPKAIRKKKTTEDGEADKDGEDDPAARVPAGRGAKRAAVVLSETIKDTYGSTQDTMTQYMGLLKDYFQYRKDFDTKVLEEQKLAAEQAKASAETAKQQAGPSIGAGTEVITNLSNIIQTLVQNSDMKTPEAQAQLVAMLDSLNKLIQNFAKK